MATYRVSWTIDIEADNAIEAAIKALDIQRDQESTATVFDIVDRDSQVKSRVDLTYDIYESMTRTEQLNSIYGP